MIDRAWCEKFRAWRLATEKRIADLEAELATLKAAGAKPKQRKQKTAATADERKVSSAVLQRLNEKVGGKFRVATNGRPTSHCQLIAERIRAGATEHDLRLVVWHRHEQWGDDEDMKRYLRPATLFAPKLFDGYLDEARAAYEAATGEDPDELSDASMPAAVIQLADALKARG